MRREMVTIAFPAGITKDSPSYEWEARVSGSKLFLNFGSVVALMFDDVQEGMDVLNAMVVTPPAGTVAPEPVSTEDEALFSIVELVGSDNQMSAEDESNFEPDYDGFDSRGDR